MSTAKPKALRLAEILEGDYCPDSFYKRGIDKVSAEIRAQHARITELEAQLEAIGAGMNTQQPTALWLANEMLQAATFPAYPPLPNAAVAQELRRQHARIADLEAQIEAIGAAGSSEGSHMTNTNTASGAAIQRYKIGYHSDEWGQRSSTPSGIPDASGSWVRYEDHVAALASAPAQAGVPAGFLHHVIALCTQRGYSPENIEAWSTDDKWIADLWRQAVQMIAAAPAQPVAEPAKSADMPDEREAFEAWFNKTRRMHTTEKRENGSYFSSHTNLMWEAWLARASHGQPALGSAQNDAIRRSPPTRDEMLDCAVAAYRLSPYSKDNLRRCFQSSTQQIESSCNWTANELMAFARGIAALYATQSSEKREVCDE